MTPHRLTHLNDQGAAHMVDVGDKPVTRRSATAQALVACAPATLDLLGSHDLPKGDGLAVARIAGIAAAKRTADLIPLCHPIVIDAVTVDLVIVHGGVSITATVRTEGRTGVEMEALTAASAAALTLIDMIKGVDRAADISGVWLVEKAGGRSGTWRRQPTVVTPQPTLSAPANFTNFPVSAGQPDNLPADTGNHDLASVTPAGSELGVAGQPVSEHVVDDRADMVGDRRTWDAGQPVTEGGRNNDRSPSLTQTVAVTGVTECPTTSTSPTQTPTRTVTATVITVSDRVAAGVRADQSGPVIARLLAEAGVALTAPVVVPDEPAAIERAILAAARQATVIVTTGGTGITPRDQTPQTVQPLLEFELPGLTEAIRAAGLAQTPMAALSRTLAGVVAEAETGRRAVVVCLPGSPAAVESGVGVLVPLLGHLVDQLAGGDHELPSGQTPVGVGVEGVGSLAHSDRPTVSLPSDDISPAQRHPVGFKD
ncbi:MAG: bifunctional molybdenum cofactor biosynthesis protein MoaC/MoaB [Propionibacteriaceae bacterium]|nr:bifunctional molybdenum cofactor biosynthesis protein MoaC/MoaB [Propionibacteriaceae bacterium]